MVLCTQEELEAHIWTAYQGAEVWWCAGVRHQQIWDLIQDRNINFTRSFREIVLCTTNIHFRARTAPVEFKIPLFHISFLLKSFCLANLKFCFTPANSNKLRCPVWKVCKYLGTKKIQHCKQFGKMTYESEMTEGSFTVRNLWKRKVCHYAAGQEHS